MRNLLIYLLFAIFTLQSSVVAAGAISENLMTSLNQKDGQSNLHTTHEHEHKHAHDEQDQHDEQHHCHGHFHFMAALIPEIPSLNSIIDNPSYGNKHDDLFPHFLSSLKRPPIHA